MIGRGQKPRREAGLGTIYRELGALIDITVAQADHGRPPFGAQDSLVPLSRLKRVAGMLEFAWENQGNWSARCPLGLSDPPVFANARDAWNSDRRGFVQVCDSLDHFLTTLCLQEAVMSCRRLVAIDSSSPVNQVIAIPLSPLWLNGRYVNEEPDHHFWRVPNADIVVMGLVDPFWIGSTSDDVSSLVLNGSAATVIH